MLAVCRRRLGRSRQAHGAGHWGARHVSGLKTLACPGITESSPASALIPSNSFPLGAPSPWGGVPSSHRRTPKPVTPPTVITIGPGHAPSTSRACSVTTMPNSSTRDCIGCARPRSKPSSVVRASVRPNGRDLGPGISASRRSTGYWPASVPRPAERLVESHRRRAADMGPTPYVVPALWAKVAIEPRRRCNNYAAKPCSTNSSQTTRAYGDSVDEHTRESARHLPPSPSGSLHRTGTARSPSRPEPCGWCGCEEGAFEPRRPGWAHAALQIVTRLHSPHAIGCRDPSTGRHYLIGGLASGPDARLVNAAPRPAKAAGWADPVRSQAWCFCSSPHGMHASVP